MKACHIKKKEKRSHLIEGGGGGRRGSMYPYHQHNVISLLYVLKENARCWASEEEAYNRLLCNLYVYVTFAMKHVSSSTIIMKEKIRWRETSYRSGR